MKLRLVLGAGFLLIGCLFLIGSTLGKDPPIGIKGADAEARADLIERAINKSAWEETSIVYWTMVGNQHIWDKERELHEVRRKGKRIQHSLKSRMGRSWNGESWEELPSGHRSEKWAWDSWVNDSFWLNPLVKLRDDGVELSSVEPKQLLVTYRQGGNTPGDQYLWTLGPDGLPLSWQMWVSIIPIGGVEVTWENWVQLKSGAWISTLHRVQGFEIKLTDVRGENRPYGIEDSDPFEGFAVIE